MPVPCDATDFTFKQREGKVNYVADDDVILWEIPYLKGEELIVMNYNFKLPSLISPNREDYKNEPIKIDF